MDFKRLALEGAELKFDDDGRKFSGYASVFGGVDAYGDTIEPGAYKETLKGRDRPIRMRWNHFGPVIGKWVTLSEDKKGLKVEGELTPGHSVAENVYASMKHGAVDGMSIGYRVKDYEVRDEIRHLKQIELVEISVVEEPADLGAKVSDVKHLSELIEQIDSIREAENILREAGGFSRTAAKALLKRVQSMPVEREARSVADLVKALQDIKL